MNERDKLAAYDKLVAERDALRAALDEARDALALARAGAMPSMNQIDRIDAALAACEVQS